MGYEVQFQMFQFFGQRHEHDFLDTAISNICGAMAAVLTACSLSYVVDHLGYFYSARLLQRQRSQKFSMFGDSMYHFAAGYVRFTNWIGLGRTSSADLLKMEKKLKQCTSELRDPNHPRSAIVLPPEEEAILVEAIVDAENLNIWSILMPAVYQLVPGSLIARLWYNAVFPPPLIETNSTIPGTEYTYIDAAANPAADDVFYGLFVISTSLALGLLLGFAMVQVLARVLRSVLSMFACFQRKNQTEAEEQRENERLERMRFRQQGVMQPVEQNDPDEKDPELVRQGMDSRWTTSTNERIGRIRAMIEVSENGTDESNQNLDKIATTERAFSTPEI